MFFDFLIKRASWDAESLGGFLDTTAFFLKYSLDVLFLEFEEGQTRIKKGCPDLRMAVEVKIGKSDVFLITQEDGAFDDVAQFANVAGP